MSREEWNRRYAEADDLFPLSPSRLLIELFPRLPKGKALDIACGEGRNAVFLAKSGYQVDAVDISEIALNKGKKRAEGLDVRFIQADLESFSIPEDRYDLIINFNYLQLSLIPSIIKGFRTGGGILFETYTVGQIEIGPPNNRAFLLEPNELLKLFSGLHVRYYREGVMEEDGGRRAVASLFAVKDRH